MALTVNVTKGAVRQIDKGMSSVALTMVLDDDGPGPGVTKSYPMTYKKGQDLTDIVGEWTALMQADIDQYKAERAIFDHALFDEAAADVKTGLVV